MNYEMKKKQEKYVEYCLSLQTRGIISEPCFTATPLSYVSMGRLLLFSAGWPLVMLFPYWYVNHGSVVTSLDFLLNCLSRLKFLNMNSLILLTSGFWIQITEPNSLIWSRFTADSRVDARYSRLKMCSFSFPLYLKNTRSIIVASTPRYNWLRE